MTDTPIPKPVRPLVCPQCGYSLGIGWHALRCPVCEPHATKTPPNQKPQGK